MIRNTFLTLLLSLPLISVCAEEFESKQLQGTWSLLGTSSVDTVDSKQWLLENKKGEYLVHLKSNGEYWTERKKASNLVGSWEVKGNALIITRKDGRYENKILSYDGVNMKTHWDAYGLGSGSYSFYVKE